VEEPKKKPEHDRFLKIKHIAYCWSKGPLGETQFKDFVKYCKFQLCFINKILVKDPIWDEYTEEEILVEYYAHVFMKDKDAVKEFEIGVSEGEVLDFGAWADLEMKKEAEAQATKIAAQEDRVAFTPDDVMGEES
jgi:hypothetical protein